MNEFKEVELSGRGKKQLKSIVYTEIKEQIDVLIKPYTEKIAIKRIESKLETFFSYGKLDTMVENVIKRVHWKMVEEMLQKADFQDKLQDEIIKYLHKRWACGSVPFDEQFETAFMKAVKKLIK